ncbi:MAG: gamma-butyrobetaine hydroxylase-like domain-containing protein, partial [Nitrospinales bacterium]
MNEKTQADQDGPLPKKVRQVDDTTLGIDWSDGHDSVFSVKMLRENCPCANCIDEWT